MTNRHRTNDPIAEVLAKKEDLGLVQSVTYTSNGALAIKGAVGTLLLPAGSCKPSTAADITDLLDMGEHTRTLPLFRVGDRVEIERQGRTRRFKVTGTL